MAGSLRRAGSGVGWPGSMFHPTARGRGLAWVDSLTMLGGVAGSLSIAGSGVGSPSGIFQVLKKEGGRFEAPLSSPLTLNGGSVGSLSEFSFWPFKNGGVAGSFNIAGSGVGSPSGMFHSLVGAPALRNGGVAGSLNIAGSGVGSPSGMFHSLEGAPALRNGGVAGSLNIAGSGVGSPSGMFHSLVGAPALRNGGVAGSFNSAGSGVGSPFGMFHVVYVQSGTRLK